MSRSHFPALGHSAAHHHSLKDLRVKEPFSILSGLKKSKGLLVIFPTAESNALGRETLSSTCLSIVVVSDPPPHIPFAENFCGRKRHC